MSAQLDMFGGGKKSAPAQRAGKPAPLTKQASLSARWEEFCDANPHVLVEMLRLARNRLARGETRIGVKALWEELRESLRVQRLGDYKLNNSYTALAARALIAIDPSLAAVIETRRRTAK